MPDTPEDQENDGGQDFEEYLAEREKMDALFKQKFSKRVTVMFTDLKGSTAIAEKEGDLSSRMMIKYHNETVFPLIKKHNGVLVKTMGDGTLSYFEEAQDAIRASVEIQKGMDDLNVAKKAHVPVLMRIGLHTGVCIVEQNDIFGDVVNTASRFETAANPGEIYLSEETYNALTDKSEIYSRFIKTQTLKGKSEPFRIYKAFWNKAEIDVDIKGLKAKEAAAEPSLKKGLPSYVKIALIILIPIILILIFTQAGKFTSRANPGAGTRSLDHRAGTPVEERK